MTLFGISFTFGWELIWKLWIIEFIIIESVAVIHPRGESLSSWVWRWFNTGDGWSIERYLLLTFCVWILGHFVWEKWS